jgi:hypothetical protein
MLVFTFWVLCCAVHYDFHIKTMFGWSLPPVVCRMVHVLFTWFMLVYSETFDKNPSSVDLNLTPVFSRFRVAQNFVICGLLWRYFSTSVPTFLWTCMSYSRDLCLFTHSGVRHLLCFVFVLFSSSCVPYVASLSKLHFCDFCYHPTNNWW